MTIWDAAGYVASTLVVTAFCMKDILRLRVVASLSNVAFLAYGLALGLVPVWLLHALLLPVNLWRLWQYCSRERASRALAQVSVIRMGAQRPKVSRSRASTAGRISGAVTWVRRNPGVRAPDARCLSRRR